MNCSIYFFKSGPNCWAAIPAKRLTGDVLRLLQVLKKGHSCRFYSMCWSTGGRQLWTHQLFICKWGGNFFLIIIIIYFFRNASLNTVQSGIFLFPGGRSHFQSAWTASSKQWAAQSTSHQELLLIWTLRPRTPDKYCRCVCSIFIWLHLFTFQSCSTTVRKTICH